MPVQATGGEVRKTTLVMTLGPAMMQGDRLRESLKEADAVRLNASHGDPESRAEALLKVRALALELGRSIPVFLDLQGPKWRIGLLDAPLDLVEGSEGVFYLPGSPVPQGSAWAAPLPHPELFEGAAPGQLWLLDDGAITVKILAKSADLLKAQVADLTQQMTQLKSNLATGNNNVNIASSFARVIPTDQLTMNLVVNERCLGVSRAVLAP